MYEPDIAEEHRTIPRRRADSGKGSPPWNSPGATLGHPSKLRDTVAGSEFTGIVHSHPRSATVRDWRNRRACY
jgi:hypothetical protein